MTIQGALLLIYVFLGLVYGALLIIVLHTYQTRTRRLPPVFFWEFRKELRDEFPDATGWARAIFILALALIPVWAFNA